MNNPEISNEHELSVQNSSLNLQRNQTPTNIINRKRNLTIFNLPARLLINIESRSRQQQLYMIYCGSISSTITIIFIATMIVCLTSPKLNIKCLSNFETVIDENELELDSNPYDVATGYLNNDNFLDIVVVNSDTNKIGIFLNDGNGSFTSQITFSTGDDSKPRSVAVGDMNNDSYLDIIVANYNTHNIGIFYGYGNGSFRNETTFFLGISRPLMINVGDINNDDWLDIIIINNGTNSIIILFGDMNGSFKNQISYFIGYDSFPSSIVSMDLNHDHYLDIAVVNYGTNNLGIFFGYGNGSFEEEIISLSNKQSKPSSITTNDFNNDGHIDIAIANSGTNTIGIFLSYGNGSFQSQITYPIIIIAGSNSYSIKSGDFNQDNQSDVVVSSSDTNNICIFIGNGNGSFAIPPTIHSTGIDSNPYGISIGDFNNDNQSDIVVAAYSTNNIIVFIGYHMIQSQNPTTYSTGIGSLPLQIISGDFNNDAQLDVAVVNTGTNNLGIFLGCGNGSFEEQIIYSTGETSHPVALCMNDLNNDEHLDIVVANSNTQSLGIFYGYSNGTFSSMILYDTGNYSWPNDVIIDDFNNDNNYDIAYVDYGTNNLGIFLGYGNKTFANVMIYSTRDGSRPLSLISGDFNKDNRIDIVVANYGTNDICIFHGFGNGTFILFEIYSTGDGSLPSMITISDLNNDSYLDIIVANFGTNNVGIFYGLNNDSFDAQITYSTSTNSKPLWVSVDDYNNDNYLDLAIANSNLNNIGILLGNGLGYFTNPTTYSDGPSSTPKCLAVGDFNKDNRLDIVVASYSANNIAILLGHPKKNIKNQTNLSPILLGNYYADFTSEISYSTGSSFGPYSIAVGDLNNDTQMDFIVANSDDGSLGIVFGFDNGSYSVENKYLLSVGSTPRHVLIDDFNKDNKLDVVVTNFDQDNIIVLLGKEGDGLFASELIYSTGIGSNPKTLAIAQLTNDEYLDVIVTNSGTDSLGLFYGFSYIVFTSAKACESGENSTPTSVAIGDFNNDGHLDLVSTLLGSSEVCVFFGYGNGTFSSMMIYSQIPASSPWSVAVGDFNNDNQQDLTIANWGIDSIGVLLGYGNGSFSTPILYSTGLGTRPISIAIGDFNNDNQQDITVANAGGGSIGLFFGYGNGSFENVILLSTGNASHPSSVTIADMNNDNQLDIIVANEGIDAIGIFFGYGNGSFTKQLLVSCGDHSSPWYAIAGDFNQDGRLDLATANYATSSIGVFYGYGNGSFGNLTTYSTGINSNPVSLKIGDFNNDNQLDIIAVDETSTNVGIFYGYSDGTFASISITAVGDGSTAYGVAIGDFNADNRLDFVISDASKNDIQVFLASGNQPFGGQTMLLLNEGSQPSSVVVGHFNNDSQIDIATANYGTNTIGILLGCGNRMYLNSTLYSTGNNSYPSSLAIGDFNKDSMMDL
ncbi:unnamed protein product, partial [Adineta steineri]